MNERQYHNAISRCVRCGACKALCPTYFASANETMSARGRVAMLGGIADKHLSPGKGIANDIFSCVLCEACKESCPVGINIPEVIYHARINLKKRFRKGNMLRRAVQFSIPRMDTAFTVLRGFQKFFYTPFYRTGRLRHIPEITSAPFKNNFHIYKNRKRAGRIAIFAGCGVNYFYPRIGEALLNILLSKQYEVVVLKGEVCCGAPMRALGLEDEALKLAQKNIALFENMRADAILSACPTCTMVIKQQYPKLTGKGIPNIMDISEFFLKHEITKGLEVIPEKFTYHDPCHLSYGLGITDEPRKVLSDIKGFEIVEMKGAKECCGFGGFFSACFKEMSLKIGRIKIENIKNTHAETVVTSCPGCMMQLEELKRQTNAHVNIIHLAEVVDEAMHGQVK